MTQPIAVYTAERSSRDFGLVARQMVRGARLGRYMAFRIFLKDIRGEYARSLFGALWDFAEPLVVALIFIALYRVAVIPPGDIAIPYPVFVVFGMLLWQTFTEAILLPLDVIRKSKNLISHQKVAPEALLISIVYRLLFNSSFRIVILIALAACIGRFDPAANLAFSWIGAFKFLALYPAILLLGLAFGVLLAPINTIYADVGRIVRIALRPLLYASPVLWAIPRLNVFEKIYAFNPIATTIDALRSVATLNVLPDPTLLAVTTAALAAMLLVGWYVFHVSIPILAERV
jgi:lipopolysaccharide transport system permease protein